MHILISELARDLPEQTQTVHNPECAPVSRRHEVVVLDSEVVHRRHRQVAPHRVPIFAIVIRHIDSRLRPCVQKARALGIFTDAARKVVLRQIADDGLPSRAVVCRLEQKRPVVVELVPRSRQISRSGIVRRNFYHIDARPLLQFSGSNIFPVCAAIP